METDLLIIKDDQGDELIAQLDGDMVVVNAKYFNEPDEKAVLLFFNHKQIPELKALIKMLEATRSHE